MDNDKVDPFFDPSCCSYKLSGEIRNHIDELVKNESVDKQIKSILKELMDEDEANKNTLNYTSLVKLHKYIQRADSNYIQPFYVFSDSCKCIRPKPRENEQLESRLKRLRLSHSQNMYNDMTASVDRTVRRTLEKKEMEITSPNSSNNGSTGDTKELQFFSGSMMAVINSFLVYICTFVFCYKAVEYSLPQPNVIAQVLFGLLGSTVVACAELYFLARVI